MPNWSYNNLQVSGDAKVMKEFYSEAIKNNDKGEPEFRLSNLFPMPEKIKNTISPSSSARGRKWIDEDKSDIRDISISGILGEESNVVLIPVENNTEEKCRQLVAEFGADNWYDWNIKAYGTKWDVSATEFDIEDEHFNVWFDTAWSPPGVFLEKLQLKYPQLNLELVYDLEGSNDCGKFSTYRDDNGVHIDHEEGELSYRAYDGRDVYYNDSVGDWCYQDTGEVCEDYEQINPFH